MRIYRKIVITLPLFLLGLVLTVQAQKAFPPQSPNDSGMWLLPQIRGTVHSEMVSKGLKLPADAFYSADKPSLNQAIMRVNIGNSGSATGSFVSSKGLILTNHHVGYDALASASSADTNYLDQGFYAPAMEQEIPAQGYSLYIPIEQTEVTQQITERVPDSLSYRERMQKEQQVREALIAKRKGNDDDLLVEIDDYWAGNRQFMAVYQVIRDVRLVYAPPSSIGKYGGDIDNWMWPRQTGDYTFLRAYVAPDGEARPYNKDNVPYHPDKHLKINANGVKPGDFTMTLGFPGNTYRHQSSYAFNFYENHRNEYLIESFQAVLDALEESAKNDPDHAVETASERASLANSLKYFKGVQTGFKKYHIVDQKRKIEDKFKDWIQQDSARKAEYGRVLGELDKSFRIAAQSSDILYLSLYALNYNQILGLAQVYQPYFNYLNHPDSLSISEEKKNQILQQQRQMLRKMDLSAQNDMLAEMLYNMQQLPEDHQLPYLYMQFGDKQEDTLKTAIHQFLAKQRETSVLYDTVKAKKLLEMPLKKARKQKDDAIIGLYDSLQNAFQTSRRNYIMHYSYLRPARKRYVKGMLEMSTDSTHYADANNTLRLSGGRVMGYSPEDGVYNTPFTTLKGMIAKDTDQEPFDAPQRLEDYYAKVENGDTTRSKYTFRGHLPIDFLSTNDITGGNSGSPVLNANGDVVGVAFDGNIEGVVGDYFYDPDLNRTISLDVRYLLFLMDRYDHTQRLLDEMDIIGPDQEKATMK